MHAIPAPVAALARVGATAMVLLATPVCAHADDGLTDRHEIPTFVLKRTEVVFYAEDAAAAPPPPAHQAAQR